MSFSILLEELRFGMHSKRDMDFKSMNNKIEYCVVSLSCIVLLSGCFPIEEPAPLDANWGKDWDRNRVFTEAEKQHYISYSYSASNLGWAYLYDGQFDNKMIPDNFRIKQAMSLFNMSYSFSSSNNQSNWGWGIVRGFQAQRSADKKLTEKYLKQSTDFLEKALKVAKDYQKYWVSLDLANSYNALIAFYAKNKEAGKEKWINKAEKLISQLVLENNHDGRVYFLWAITLYYKGDIRGAREKALKAEGASTYRFALCNKFKTLLGL